MPQGAVIFGPEGRTLTDWEKSFFRDCDPLGFILFARNVDTPAQLYALTGELRDAVGRDAPVLIDQEGGRVQRLRAPYWREYLPPLEQMARARDPDRAMYLRYRLIADELRAVGIDANCAPMADVADSQTHPFLRNRCYGQTAQDVIRAARAVADGLLDGGVLPVLKHIPGHGRARVDSHKDLPRVAASRADLALQDFAPFKALNDLPMGMTAHIVFEDIDPAAPATTSATMMQLIRRDIGFDGLIMTDDLSMEALEGDVTQRATGAIAAGCDVVLHCNGFAREMEQVAAASGRLTPAAQVRADAALALRKSPQKIDISAVEAELASLLGEGPHG